MISRRNLLAAAASLSWIGSAAAQDTETSPPEIRDTLAGKRPLIKRAYRPPNFETPLEYLRAPFTANDVFYVRYHLGVIPEIDPLSWRLNVGGRSCTRAQSFSLSELCTRFDKVSIAAVNQCSGNRRAKFSPRVPGVQWGDGAMGHAIWSGIRLADVLAASGITADALEVVFNGADGPVMAATPDFVKSLPIERALDPDTLIAFEMNGAPLPHFNGAPARLVVPGWTGTYWVKHLVDIRIEPLACDSYWMRSAYRLPRGAFPGAAFASQDTLETTPITELLVNSLVTSHRAGDSLPRSLPAELRGWAWDNGKGIAAVEISTDAGRTWRESALGLNFGRFAWREFIWRIDAAEPGPQQFMVRAASRSGTRQPQHLAPNPSGYHHNTIETLKLNVL